MKLPLKLDALLVGSLTEPSKFALEGFTESLSKEMHPDWKVKFLIIEPGGVKTNFAGPSMKFSARHPAYRDPGCPFSQVMVYMSNESIVE